MDLLAKAMRQAFKEAVEEGVKPLKESMDERLTGAVYRASGWIPVGTTQGRGRYDRDKLYDKPRKDVWLRPLRRDWKRTLNR